MYHLHVLKWWVSECVLKHIDITFFFFLLPVHSAFPSIAAYLQVQGMPNSRIDHVAPLII